MKKTRCKFQCYTRKDTDYGVMVDLHPVYSTDPESENKAFWDSTPSGHLQLTISNKPAAEIFVEGQEYYLDITPCTTEETP
ncbi:MAG TPA: hypothetical protein VGB52_02695 [Actinomycetota bacterium]|jgi:hypothetical protein